MRLDLGALGGRPGSVQQRLFPHAGCCRCCFFEFIVLLFVYEFPSYEVYGQAVPECVQSLSMNLPQQLLAESGNTRGDGQSKMARAVLGDRGLGGIIRRIGDDALGSLGQPPEIWRPGMLRSMPLPPKLFSPFWPGWCERVGFPVARCCRGGFLKPELECFDAMHTRERCCIGRPKAVAKLYHIMPWPQVWTQGPCLPIPPRTVFAHGSTGGRLLVCERWEGKFPLMPHVLRNISIGSLVAGVSCQDYEICEEAALVNNAFKAAIVSYLADGHCISADLAKVPAELWNPRNWRLFGRGRGAVGALCLPLLTGSDNRHLKSVTGRLDGDGAWSQFDEEAMELGGNVVRLMRWAAGQYEQMTPAYMDSTRAEEVAMAGDSPPRARDANTITKHNVEPGNHSPRFSALPPEFGGRDCLLTPTYPPHFPNVALLLEAVRRLAQEPPGLRPLHVLVFDTHELASRFCVEQPQSCVDAEHVQARTHGAAPAWNGSHTTLVALVALKELVEARTESWTDVEAIEWEHHSIMPSGESKDFHRYGPCTSGWGQVHQGLKKLYGLAFARQAFGCSLTWVMDSESFPLKPFSFAEVFRAYRREPWVQVQDYGDMPGCFGAAHLILQECAHWIITHKLRLVPTGAFGYRQSDFWLYENANAESFIFEMQRSWGVRSFVDIWMRHPAHGEGMILPAWLHLRRAGGLAPSAWANSNGTQSLLRVLDVASAVREHMPALYAAACLNASISEEETVCADDFAVVPRALQALGLPDTIAELDAVLPATLVADRTTAARGTLAPPVRELLMLLRLLDRLPIFGLQGHGDALRTSSLPALLPHWSRATTWCVSNCDWRRHAGPLLRRLGFAAIHVEVLLAVPSYGERVESAGALLPRHASSTSPPRKPSGRPFRRAHDHPLKWRSAEEAEELLCFQWHVPPAEETQVEQQHVTSGWQSMERCLDILHYDG